MSMRFNDCIVQITPLLPHTIAQTNSPVQHNFLQLFKLERDDFSSYCDLEFFHSFVRCLTTSAFR